LADALVERLLAHMKKICVGDGLEPGTTMGPLVSMEQMETVAGYVRKGVEGGAQLIGGGQRLTADPENQGYFYAPTLFDRVAPDSPLACEEIFGPVLPVIRVRDAEEAFQIANQTRYGLAASLFTQNTRIVQEFIKRMKSGMVHVNHGTASQPHIPFGGVKDSGQGAYSIGPTVKEAFTNIKTVYIKW